MRIFQILSQKGFNLAEVLIVVVIIGFLGVLISVIPNSLTLMGKSNHLSVAREIVNKQIEEKRSTTFESLTNGEMLVTDSRISALPSGSGKIVTQDCPVSICTNGEVVKQITVTIDWKESGKPQQLSTVTLISSGGLTK